MKDTATASTPIEPQDNLNPDPAPQDPAPHDPPAPEPPTKYDFVKDKYRTNGRSEDDALREQAKAYAELEKRLGARTGAPDDYTVDLAQEIKDAGYEFDTEDPLFNDAKALAKSLDLSQEGFNQMMSIYAQAEMAKDLAYQAELREQIKAMGPDGERRIKDLEAWANKSLPDDLRDGFLEAGVSINAIRAMEHIVSMTLGKPVNPVDAVSAPAMTETELRNIQFAVDQNGVRLMSYDKDHQRKYYEARARLYGSGDHIEIIGSGRA